jgi:hypothetical protein
VVGWFVWGSGARLHTIPKQLHPATLYSLPSIVNPLAQAIILKMSEAAAKLIDPGGTVRDYCVALGFEAENEKSPRYYRHFSRKATDFRKKYLKRMGISMDPPYTYESPEIRLCTTAFFQEFPDEFADIERDR